MVFMWVLLSWLSWNLEGWFFWREEIGELGEKPMEQGENQQQTEPTYGTMQESNPGHVGGR